MTAIEVRLVVLLVAGAAAILCLYFAWDLTKRNLGGEHQADLSAPGITLKLRKFGPGAIFALIGIGLLGYIVSQKATRTVDPMADITYDAEGNAAYDYADESAAVTDSIGTVPGAEPSAEPEPALGQLDQ